MKTTLLPPGAGKALLIGFVLYFAAAYAALVLIWALTVHHG